jgi:hypothetical protein
MRTTLILDGYVATRLASARRATVPSFNEVFNQFPAWAWKRRNSGIRSVSHLS